jgi:hypothetical protein
MSPSELTEIKMTSSDADRNFTRSLEAAMAKLAGSPFDVEVLKDLRMIGFRRSAAGGTSEGKIRKHQTRDVNELLDWYRQMAWEPTRIDPLVEIANLLEELMPPLTGSDRDAAEKVRFWAIKMAKRIAGSN